MTTAERRRRLLRAWVPRWWRGEAGLVGEAASIVLAPAEALFRGAVAARGWGYDAGLLRTRMADIPVISVGNIGVGGAGKTPFAAWLVGRLREWGRRPAVVLRGYGKDEILVHGELNPGVPVFASRRRADAVATAAAEGCDVAVLDDAFQHRALDRDLDLVLVAADGWTGPLRLLPRGPWREGLGALRRADLVVITRKAEAEEAVRRAASSVGEVVGAARLVICRIAPAAVQPLVVPPSGEAGGGGDLDSLSGRRVLAVASLADPRPFVENLRAAGVQVELSAFPDHHEFTVPEAEALRRKAADRPLVMTRKEAVKLRALLPADVEAWVLDQRVEIESGGEALDESLRRAVGA